MDLAYNPSNLFHLWNKFTSSYLFANCLIPLPRPDLWQRVNTRNKDNKLIQTYTGSSCYRVSMSFHQSKVTFSFYLIRCCLLRKNETIQWPWSIMKLVCTFQMWVEMKRSLKHLGHLISISSLENWIHPLASSTLHEPDLTTIHLEKS